LEAKAAHFCLDQNYSSAEYSTSAALSAATFVHPFKLLRRFRQSASVGGQNVFVSSSKSAPFIPGGANTEKVDRWLREEVVFGIRWKISGDRHGERRPG